MKNSGLYYVLKAPVMIFLSFGIYSLLVLSIILKVSNRRYLEFITTFDYPSDGLKHLNKVLKTVEASECTYKGVNFYNKDDQKLLEVLARVEFNIKGFKIEQSVNLYLKRVLSLFPRLLKDSMFMD